MTLKFMVAALLLVALLASAVALKIDSFIDTDGKRVDPWTGEKPRLRPLETPIKSFDLTDVELHKSTFQSRAEASNLEYLLQLDPDRMLYVFRANAKLPTPGVPFQGTWVSASCSPSY